MAAKSSGASSGNFAGSMRTKRPAPKSSLGSERHRQLDKSDTAIFLLPFLIDVAAGAVHNYTFALYEGAFP